MKIHVSHVALLALVFSISTAFAQNPNQVPDRTGRTDRTDRSATAQEGKSAGKNAKFDREFVQKAAEGNLAEIEMAKMAQEKAASPEVKQLAQTIEQDHQKAQEKLESMAQGENLNLPSQPSQKATQEKQKLEAMSAQQFEQEYVHHMVQEHKKDIKEFERATKNASGDVQQYASSTLPALQKHLQMAQQIEGKGKASTQAHE